MHHRTLYSLLAFAGATPFIACALLPLAGIAEVDPVGRLDRLAGVYGLAIVCFLTGVHWATDLYKQNSTALNLFVASNVILLIVGAAFVAAGIAVALLAQVAAFVTLLGIDYRLLGAGTLSKDYFRVRCVATTLAVASLITIVLTVS